jgi:hypothetical protein
LASRGVPSLKSLHDLTGGAGLRRDVSLVALKRGHGLGELIGGDVSMEARTVAHGHGRVDRRGHGGCEGKKSIFKRVSLGSGKGKGEPLKLAGGNFRAARGTKVMHGKVCLSLSVRLLPRRGL